MGQFKVRTYDPDRKPSREPSPAQKAARDRAFQIFQLRGLWSLCHRVSQPRRSMIQALIDDDLRALGAEPEGDRQRERRLKFEEEWARTHPEPTLADVLF